MVRAKVLGWADLSGPGIVKAHCGWRREKQREHIQNKKWETGPADIPQRVWAAGRMALPLTRERSGALLSFGHAY